MGIVLRWVVALGLIVFGLASFLLTDRLVDHGFDLSRHPGATTAHRQVVWQGIISLVLGLAVGPARSLGTWYRRRQASNRQG